MVNQIHVEALFDCIDASATLLYKTYGTPYLEGVVKTCENIIANEVEDSYKEIQSDLEGFIAEIEEIEFHKEEIRKAFQFACLKGFKHANVSNQMITPETIGIFFEYLISKLYQKTNLVILDPLVGTGNLITVIANHLKDKVTLVGVDWDQQHYQLSSALFDMLGYGDQVFYQDTNTFTYAPIDLAVADFSGINEDETYQIIKHHGDHIVPGGFMLGLLDGALVKQEVLIKQAKQLNQIWSLFGLIQLPKGLSKTDSKAIVIFQRKGEQVFQPKKFLLAELPDFKEKEAFKNVINQLNHWFRNIEFYKIGE